MKEKIRQFARESGLDIYGLGKDRAKWEDTMIKFAELMVRDIYQYVDGLDTAQIISNGILKRYGVEE